MISGKVREKGVGQSRYNHNTMITRHAQTTILNFVFSHQEFNKIFIECYNIVHFEERN